MEWDTIKRMVAIEAESIAETIKENGITPHGRRELFKEYCLSMALQTVAIRALSEFTYSEIAAEAHKMMMEHLMREQGKEMPESFKAHFNERIKRRPTVLTLCPSRQSGQAA